MKLRKVAVWVAMAGMMGGAMNSIAADGEKPPVPKLARTISLAHRSSFGALTGSFAPVVRKLSFSPDGRYLGIVEERGKGPTDVVVWDIARGKEQARIVCDGQADAYADSPNDILLWLQGGKAVSFGFGQQWDVTTGKRLPDYSVQGGSARVNKDGTKMLTLFGESRTSAAILVYDTKTWSKKTIGLGGAPIAGAAWTADNNIVAVMGEPAPAENTMAKDPGARPQEAAIRLMDLDGKTLAERRWIPVEGDGRERSAEPMALPDEMLLMPSYATNQVFLPTGDVIDGATLAVRRYHSRAENDKSPGDYGMSVSPNGRWLYLKGFTSSAVSTDKPIPNMIVDTRSGEPVSRLAEAAAHVGGIAASPDGKWLAIGDGRQVYLYRLE